MLTTLRAAKFAESYHTKITDKINISLVKQAEESVAAALDEFKEQLVKNCEANGAFDKARDGKWCSFTCINQANSKIIHQDTANVRDETPTGNAWKVEDYLGGKWFKKLEDMQMELDNWIHDACAQLSKRVPEHIAHFKKLLNAENPDVPFVPRTQDNFDTWHSGRSYYKLWLKMVEIKTKVVKRGNKKLNTKADPKATIQWRETAAKQLKGVEKRIKQAFMQVTGAVDTTHGQRLSPEEKKKVTMDALGQMLVRCLVHDDHSMCKDMCGDKCACVVQRDIEAHFSQLNPERAEWENMPHALAHDEKYNMYTVEQQMKEYFAKVAEKATVEEEEEDLTLEEELELMEKEEERVRMRSRVQSILDSDDEDDDDYTDTDPFQPKKNVLTHPLAIECLLEFVNCKHLETIISKNMNCYSTSMVESFNSMIRIYAPKRWHFSKSMKARAGMATLYWNENVSRVTHESKNTGRRYTNHREKTFMWQQEALDRVFGASLW